jgi:hypothetical protein
MSAPEYVQSALAYLDAEEERKAEYFNRSFYERIDEINNRYFVKENSSQLADVTKLLR